MNNYKGRPKSKRYWNNIRPASLTDALRACKDYALLFGNLSVEGIAELMSLPDVSALYKWMSNGRMPAILIPAFENACGIDYVTRYLGTRNGNLLVAMPTGRNVTPQDVGQLQQSLHETVDALLKFYSDKADTKETLDAICHSMESLAWHKGNVEQYNSPQLDL